MYINHSGWSEKYGSFSYDVFIDEEKTDYELHYSKGEVFKQASEFQWVSADWNCDGDVYSQFGASFAYYDRNGEETSSREFLTPQEMVSLLVDGLYGDHYDYESVVVSIPGIILPPPERRPSIDERISRSEKRSMAQDIERNRKMNAFGIRSPGEPWAR